VLQRVSEKTQIKPEDLTITDAVIYQISTDEKIMSLGDLALETFYSKDGSSTISSEKSVNVKSNAIAFGCTVVDLEVDVKTGMVDIKRICNVHDSGKIINPLLAEGQVEGGMSMSCGMALTEVMTYDEKRGYLRNDNLLDYKLPTILDTPHFDVAFVEPMEPTGPFGNKALGEPPAVSPAPAIRNAILHATGVGVNATPMNPQSLFEAFRKAGLN